MDPGGVTAIMAELASISHIVANHTRTSRGPGSSARSKDRRRIVPRTTCSSRKTGNTGADRPQAAFVAANSGADRRHSNRPQAAFVAASSGADRRHSKRPQAAFVAASSGADREWNVSQPDATDTPFDAQARIESMESKLTLLQNNIRPLQENATRVGKTVSTTQRHVSEMQCVLNGALEAQDETDRAVTGLLSRIQPLQTKMNRIQSGMGELEFAQDGVNSGMGDLQQRTTEYLDALVSAQKRICTLEQTIEDLQNAQDEIFNKIEETEPQLGILFARVEKLERGGGKATRTREAVRSNPMRSCRTKY